jgi:hypothetical protein
MASLALYQTVKNRPQDGAGLPFDGLLVESSPLDVLLRLFVLIQ